MFSNPNACDTVVSILPRVGVHGLDFFWGPDWRPPVDSTDENRWVVGRFLHSLGGEVRNTSGCMFGDFMDSLPASAFPTILIIHQLLLLHPTSAATTPTL